MVAVSTHLRLTGQGLVGGGTIDMRDNHSLHILQRQPDGRWLVVSEIYMDARQDRTYAGRSAAIASMTHRGRCAAREQRADAALALVRQPQGVVDIAALLLLGATRHSACGLAPAGACSDAATT